MMTKNTSYPQAGKLNEHVEYRFDWSGVYVRKFIALGLILFCVGNSFLLQNNLLEKWWLAWMIPVIVTVLIMPILLPTITAVDICENGVVAYFSNRSKFTPWNRIWFLPPRNGPLLMLFVRPVIYANHDTFEAMGQKVITAASVYRKSVGTRNKIK